MSASGSGRPSPLRRSLDRLAHDAEDLVESLDTESRLAGEEVVGAEILATRDLVANLGVAWETMEQLGDVARRQAQHFAEDNLATLSQWLADPLRQDWNATLERHLERRLTHIAEGLEEGYELFARQSEKTLRLMFALWSPFYSVVRQDWAREGARRSHRDADR